MNWTLIFLLINIVGLVIYYGWTMCGWALWSARVHDHEPREIFRTIFCETKPFYWPAVAAVWVPNFDWHDWWEWVGPVAATINWIAFRNEGGDDDRWKRRRRRVAEAVKSVGSRLVVVPVPAGA